MTDIQEALKRIQKLEDDLNQHLRGGAVRSALIENLSHTVTRLDHTVYGNGKEGLTTIIARTDERLTGMIESVNGLPETIKHDIDEAIEKVLLKVEPAKEEKKHSTADNAWKWFSDRILPYFATGLLIIVLQAVWDLLKQKLNTP
jgi:hypothetical protein